MVQATESLRAVGYAVVYEPETTIPKPYRRMSAMARARTWCLCSVGLFFAATVFAVAPGDSSGAKNDVAESLPAGEVVVFAGEEHVVTLEGISVRRIGDRTFLVGREVAKPEHQLTIGRFGGGMIWLPLDQVESLVEPVGAAGKK
jgi:hypothetical protein